MVFSIIAFAVTWWYLYWEDCSLGGEASLSLNLHRGVCTDDMNDCTSWSDINADQDDGDSDAYITAHGLCVTAIVFTLCFLILTSMAFIPAVKQSAIVQYVRMSFVLLMLFVSILLITALATTTHTWYTDTENYAFYKTVCDSSSSRPSFGWICALFGVIFCYLTILFAVCPCCACADQSDHGGDNDPFVPASGLSDAKH